MKHAGDAALDQVEVLLEALRKQCQLQERKRGVFYFKASAFLHFHEDPEGLFADLRAGSDWERFPVTTKQQRKILLAKVEAFLARLRD